MTSRTRLFVGVAVGILVVGLGTGLLASYMGGFQGLSILGGNGPDEFAYVASDARLVASANVRELTMSGLREQLREFEPKGGEREKLEAETGIDIERDVDRVVVAAWAASGETTPGIARPLMLARGQFNPVQIEGVVQQHGGIAQDYKGIRFLESPDGKLGVAFLEPGLVALGEATSVRNAIDTKLAGTGTIRDNAEVMRLVRDVDQGHAWAVARFDALAGRAVPQAIASQLPPINWFAFSSRITDHIEATIQAETRTEASAGDLRDVIRGFIALARLQSGQHAAFADLANSIELGGQGTTVSLGFSVPAALIETWRTAARADRDRRGPDGSGERERQARPEL